MFGLVPGPTYFVHTCFARLDFYHHLLLPILLPCTHTSPQTSRIIHLVDFCQSVFSVNLSYQTDLHFFWNLADAIDSDMKIRTYRHAYLDFPLGIWLVHLCIISVRLLLHTVTCDAHIDLADYLISGGSLACTTTPLPFMTFFLECTHIYRNTGTHLLHLYHHPLPTTPHPWRFTL